MQWKSLNNIDEFHSAIQDSYNEPIAIFKHSIRCSVSFVVKKTIERFWEFSNNIYYIDLINNREISDMITSELSVEHQSPQILIVKNGISTYDASHGMIDIDEISEYL